MRFEWDPIKEKVNRRKHKVTFLKACYVFADKYILTLYDEEHSVDEDRWITIGQTLDGRILVIIYEYRKIKGKEFVRIISARKATKHEENNILKGEKVNTMKRKYDFSKAEQGKFYRPIEKLEIPVYLDKEVKKFFSKTASKRKIGLDKVVNTILRKEMETLKAIGA